MPRRSPFSSRSDRPPPSDLVSPPPRAPQLRPSPGPAEGARRRVRHPEWMTATVRGPLPPPPINWKRVGLPLTPRQGKAGAADEEGESLPTPAAPARPGPPRAQPPPGLGARTRPHRACSWGGGGGPAELRGEGPSAASGHQPFQHGGYLRQSSLLTKRLACKTNGELAGIRV